MLSDLYDKKYLFKCLFWLGATFGLMRVTGGAGFAIVIPMVFYAFLARKTESLLFWFLVAVCAIIVNPHIVPKGGGFAWMQRGLMVFIGGVMSLNVMIYPMHGATRPYAGMLFYILVMILSSAQGWNPKISFLKLLLFSLVYFSYLGVANQIGVNRDVSSRRIRSIMLSLAVLFVLGSMAVVPFPALSQMRADDFENGTVDMASFKSLFMGMTNHSQCLGPVVASISVVLLGDMLFSIRRADPLYVVMLLCCPYLVYLTSSRTGMGAYLIGQLFVLWVFMRAMGTGSRWKARVASSFMLLLTFLFAVFVCTPAMQDKAAKFLLKQGDQVEKVTVERIVNSRQGLMESALYNFRKSPLIGNGFQVSVDMKDMKTKGQAVLSAPIEKGVWVTAVLEEGGVVGWTVLVLFFIGCISKSIRRGAYIGASCLFVSILINLGEFSLFSMSYVGGFTWAMVFMGLALDMRKMSDENEAIRRQMEFEQMQMEMNGVTGDADDVQIPWQRP